MEVTEGLKAGRERENNTQRKEGRKEGERETRK